MKIVIKHQSYNDNTRSIGKSLSYQQTLESTLSFKSSMSLSKFFKQENLSQASSHSTNQLNGDQAFRGMKQRINSTYNPSLNAKKKGNNKV